jgi:exonuclease SbcD
MKFIHTGDLHIGKRINEIDLLADQRYILSQISSYATDADGLIIAGDSYDVPVPSGEAMNLYAEFVESVAEKGKMVFAISGNHDSTERLSHMSHFLKKSGYYVSDKFNGKLQKIELNDEYGVLNIYLLPFIKPVNVSTFTGEKYENTGDAIKAVIRNTEIDYNERNILVLHQYVIPETTEEGYIGTLEMFESTILKDFDYVAVGHIHSPSALSYNHIRYCGSPLKYSMNEKSDNKSVTLVEFKEKGNVSIKLLPLKPLRDMREVKGTLEELLSMNPTDDYVSVIATDEDISPDARISVSTVFPNMIKFSVENSKTGIISEEIEMLEEKSKLELFKDFYMSVNGGVEPTEKHIEIFESVVKEIKE